MDQVKYDLNRSIKEEFDRKPPATVERRAGWG